MNARKICQVAPLKSVCVSPEIYRVTLSLRFERTEAFTSAHFFFQLFTTEHTGALWFLFNRLRPRIFFSPAETETTESQKEKQPVLKSPSPYMATNGHYIRHDSSHLHPPLKKSARNWFRSPHPALICLFCLVFIFLFAFTRSTDANQTIDNFFEYVYMHVLIIDFDSSQWVYCGSIYVSCLLHSLSSVRGFGDTLSRWFSTSLHDFHDCSPVSGNTTNSFIFPDIFFCPRKWMMYDNSSHSLILVLVALFLNVPMQNTANSTHLTIQNPPSVISETQFTMNSFSLT